MADKQIEIELHEIELLCIVWRMRNVGQTLVEINHSCVIYAGRLPEL